jgi:hypothetical protein
MNIEKIYGTVYIGSPDPDLAQYLERHFPNLTVREGYHLSDIQCNDITALANPHDSDIIAEMVVNFAIRWHSYYGSAYRFPFRKISDPPIGPRQLEAQAKMEENTLGLIPDIFFQDIE